MTVALGLVVFMVYTGFEVSAGQWEPSFDRGPLHMGTGATGLATFGYWGALTLARFALAAPRRPLSQAGIVRWGCIVALGGAALVWWRPSTVVALLGLVVIGGALAGIFPALVALTPSRVGEEMARHVIGWQIGAANIGGSAISAAFGAVFQHYGLREFGPALVVMAVVVLVGAVVLERAAPAQLAGAVSGAGPRPRRAWWWSPARAPGWARPGPPASWPGTSGGIGLQVCARKPAQSFGPDEGPTDAERLAEATGESAAEVCPPWRWYPRPMAPPMAAESLGLPPFSLDDLVARAALAARRRRGPGRVRRWRGLAPGHRRRRRRPGGAAGARPGRCSWPVPGSGPSTTCAWPPGRLSGHPLVVLPEPLRPRATNCTCATGAGWPSVTACSSPSAPPALAEAGRLTA